MRLKKLGAALAIVAALGAILASSAFATATTKAAEWYTGTAPGTTLSGSLPVDASAKTTATFETEVGTTKVKLTSTELECQNCVISNTPTGASGHGFLVFKKITVDSPPNCTLASVKTKELNVNADYMETIEGKERALVLFTPTAGSTTGFASFELEGASCALSTPIVPKGTVFGLAENLTGENVESQEVTFSGPINSAAGGSLLVGTKAATISGTATFKATNPEGTAVKFGVH